MANHFRAALDTHSNLKIAVEYKSSLPSNHYNSSAVTACMPRAMEEELDALLSQIDCEQLLNFEPTNQDPTYFPLQSITNEPLPSTRFASLVTDRELQEAKKIAVSKMIEHQLVGSDGLEGLECPQTAYLSFTHRMAYSPNAYTAQGTRLLAE